MSSDMYEGQIPTIQYNILLTEKILTNQRKYIQFIDILGDVGGLMEIVYSIFGAISFFFADIFYSKNMINHLFSFVILLFLIDKPRLEGIGYLIADQTVGVGTWVKADRSCLLQIDPSLLIQNFLIDDHAYYFSP